MARKRRIPLLLTTAAVLLVLQVFPRVRRDHPPVTGEIEAPPEVMEILRKSCFDCHSNRTRWPWYSRVAPVSWMITGDVHRARKKLNFSTWLDIPPAYRGHYVDEIVEHVESGEMPLSRYLLLHPRSRVTPEERAILKEWKSPPE